ncbi:hypothetical protein GOP47_0025013 [Adiantum capillus-veneris]|uniref:Isoamylase 1-3-like C-terminal domain-containing protein n=1 Tax=Adiantum capillus-veneris TaxID=13818 RepID=A0A9D4Z346_ADICA|nr:hypothetical protein GOP47_0025013 [Adiantum capillus-veneris]
MLAGMQRKDFVRLENIQWHGVQINEPDWENLDSSFIAVSLISDKASTECQIALGDIYIGFNSGNVSVIASLPEPPTGMSWHRIADTSLPFPQYFQEHGLFLNFAEGETRTYHIQPYSSILLEARTLAEI